MHNPKHPELRQCIILSRHGPEKPDNLSDAKSQKVKINDSDIVQLELQCTSPSANM